MSVRVVDASALGALVFGEPGAEEVVQLAGETGLSTYDASYLWLSRHLRGELVTLDQALREAAGP